MSCPCQTQIPESSLDLCHESYVIFSLEGSLGAMESSIETMLNELPLSDSDRREIEDLRLWIKIAEAYSYYAKCMSSPIFYHTY